MPAAGAGRQPAFPGAADDFDETKPGAGGYLLRNENPGGGAAHKLTSDPDDNDLPTF
jgi:hypothetical protein